MGLSQINWTLSDFFYPDYNCEVLTRQSFNCSREAAELLQFQLDLWMANNDAHANLQDFMSSCDNGIRTGCSFVTVGRPKWVNELNLNASDSQEVKVKRYLDCII